MKPVIRIKFFMDYICEWCYLGYNILDQLHDRYDFDLELLPLEIHSDTPQNGMPMDWHVENKEIWIDKMNQLGAPYGIHLLNKDIFANTRNALIFGQFAKTRGRIEEYTKQLWKVYMEQGRNISSRDVIKEVAYRCGFTTSDFSEVFENPGPYAAALERNMQYRALFGSDQVPTFVINEDYIMVGAQSAETWEQLFAQIAKEQGCDGISDYQ